MVGGAQLLDTAGAGGAANGGHAADPISAPPAVSGPPVEPDAGVPQTADELSLQCAAPVIPAGALLGELTAATPQAALQNLNAATNIVIREVEYIQALTERISALISSNERLAKTYRNYFWHMGLFASFLRGILMGFGWVIGTTIVVGVFIIFLHKFDSVPVVGEFVGRIMEYLQQRR
jgi:hypothetical protein